MNWVYICWPKRCPPYQMITDMIAVLFQTLWTMFFRNWDQLRRKNWQKVNHWCRAFAQRKDLAQASLQRYIASSFAHAQQDFDRISSEVFLFSPFFACQDKPVIRVPTTLSHLSTPPLSKQLRGLWSERLNMLENSGTWLFKRVCFHPNPIASSRSSLL